MAYDASTGDVILFGGSDGFADFGPADSPILDDTWSWNGSTWSKLAPAVVPPARADASMAYDASTGDIVLFGGADDSASGLLDDTWSWNGSTWSELAPSTVPPARMGASMAYDASTGDVILFGGSDSADSTGLLNDTWTWNGANWTNVSPASSPPARFLGSMDYDAATGSVVLFGGLGALTPLNDTWTWNGVTWTQQFPTTSPPPRVSGSMTYDASTGDAILFGGYGPTPPLPFGANALDDTWSWNGSAWTQESPASSPTARGGAPMAYDASTGDLVLFGGTAADGPALNDTWTYNGSTWAFRGPITGYSLVAEDGGIFTFGSAQFYGSTGGQRLNAPIVGMTSSPDGGGYWLAASDGGIFNYGDAQFYGSTGSMHLNKPIVGMASTTDGAGYWLVASDGGIFSFGDAQFYGSRGGQPLNAPIVGMASTPDGKGYWLVAADGGIFNYGDAPLYGSMGGQHLNAPIVGMASTRDGMGYWMVAADGGIFTFGDARFYGSMGGQHLNAPIVGIAPTLDGAGYELVASDGGVFTYGDARFYGSMGDVHLNAQWLE